VAQNRKARRRDAALSRKDRSSWAAAACLGMLGGSLFISQPARAVDQNTVFVQDIPFAETEIVTNAVKIDVTLGATIDNAGLAPFNSEVAANVNNVNVGNLNQLMEGTQTATSDNLIEITNSGEIDPAIGIFAQINNNGFDFSNLSVLSNLVGAGAVISLGDLNQVMQLSQTHSVDNRITETNSAKITADQFGIFAEINNTSITQFSNSAVTSNINGAGAIVSLGDHTQSMDRNQSNTLSNVIDVLNSGEIDPDIGIFAGITNSTINQFANSTTASNTNGTGAVVSVGDLSQTIDFDQANILANTITIDNSGRIVADDIGIFGEIENSSITQLSNSFAVSNINGDAAIVSVGNLDQEIDLDQTNRIVNVLTIENSGNIDPETGIRATITNQDITQLFNSSATSNINGDAAVVTAGAHTQSASLDQQNVIDNDVSVSSEGDIDASGTGIEALIANRRITQLRNDANHNNDSDTNSIITAGDFNQSGTFSQANVIANDIHVMNGGEVESTGPGIDALIENDTITFTNSVTFTNELDATATIGGDLTQTAGVDQANVLANTIYVANTGTLRSKTTGISAQIINQNIIQNNTVNITSDSSGTAGGDVSQSADVSQTNVVDNQIAIANSGNVWGGELGIFASISFPSTVFNNTDTVTLDTGATLTIEQRNEIKSSILIENAGAIGADTLFAIDTVGAATTIINYGGGTITGFIDLTGKSDLFDNQAGGTFEARLTSDFGLGDDLFRNRNGGTVHTADDANTRETTSFVNLNRFDNQGLISLQDHQHGDIFEISNTVGGTDLAFNASSNSTLAVDAFLGGPGSRADNFIINGDVTGKTKLQVYNTNRGSGELGAVIPVVFANADVSENAFFLDQPVNAGVFAYDLFFRPTGSGVFELRSFIGANAFILPQLVTGAQDIWHQGSATWFDRTDDLRVLLNGGAAPSGAKSLSGGSGSGAQRGNLPGAAWIRGSAGWLERDASASTTAFGRTYNFDLERDLDMVDFQMGFDLGKQGVLSPDDYLIFGLLGGFFNADLDYDKVGSKFEYNGGQVGAYATYLRGGLFVDTLLNVHIYDLDDLGALRRPGELDGTTVGVRSDAGYRFGGFNGGAFIEPLATLEATWADIDGFTSGGTSVSFGDDANVRGRLGLRAGTSRKIWEEATLETFVIGSLWGNLSGDNKATVVSNGTTFRFKDDLDDVWGEVSGGVNLTNPANSTSLFAKVDVTFGDDVVGVGGKAGIRLGW